MKRGNIFYIGIILLFTLPFNSFSQNNASITLNPGWTWFSYTGASSMNLSEALSNFNDPSEGDIIKAPDESFATYSSMNGWSGSLTRLIPGMAYHYYSHAQGDITFVFSVPSTPTPPQGEVPAVTTGFIQNVLYRSAACTGSVSSETRSALIERGICWSVNENPSLSNHHAGCGSEDGSFVAIMNDLEPNTTYYVRAYAYNENGLAYGDVLSFTTTNGSPTVTTMQVSLIGSSYALGGGCVLDEGCWDVTSRGVCWSKSTEPSLDDSCASAGIGGGNYIVRMTGLAANTTYYFRSFAVNAQGTSYGDVVSFTTTDGVPLVTTLPIEDVRATSAFTGGDVVDDGGGIISERGVCWSTSHNPVYTDEHAIDVMGRDNYSIQMTGLEVSTTYYVRAYAVAEQGVSYGDEISFTTLNGHSVVTTVEVADIRLFSAFGIGDVDYDGGENVVERGYCWSTNPAPTINDSHIASGGGMGSFACNMNNLMPNTTYHACAYAVTNQGVAYGEVITFNTRSGMPSFSPLQTSDIDHNYALCTGVVTDDGDIDVVERGVCWSTRQNPTTADMHVVCGSGLGECIAQLYDLWPYTVYYVRLYAVNTNGTFYGEEVSFMTHSAPYHLISATSNPSNSGTVTIFPGVTVCDGEATSTVVPIDVFNINRNQQSEFIFSADNLAFMDGAKITSMTFYSDVETLYLGSWYVYIREVACSTLDSFMGNGDTTTYQVHYGRNLSINDHKVTVNLDTPYYYGGGNLLVGFEKVGNSGYSCSNGFYGQTVPDACVYGFSLFSGGSMTTIKGNFVPKTTFASGNINSSMSGSAVSRGCEWGSMCTLIANPNENFIFVNWTEDGIEVSAEPEYAFVVTENRNLVANFQYVGPEMVPSVTTVAADGVRLSRAALGGIVTNEYGTVTERGVCWSTTTEPTLEDFYQTSGEGLGEFDVLVMNLLPNTTYYARAYAINAFGIGYGEEVIFTTGTFPDGAINGIFTINEDGDLVYFSQGNLQYQASTDTWRFAEHQWDFVGSTVVEEGEPGGTVQGSSNHLISPTYDGWIDLFGWGTSGYDHGAVCYQPWSVSENNEDYYAYGNGEYNLDDVSGQADWGYNAISNGGNQENQWRTLTDWEWEYLLFERNTSSGMHFAKARVNGANGFVILPDDWNEEVWNLYNPDEYDAVFDSNIISMSDWADILEANGCAFLPAAGQRDANFIYPVGGAYWSSSVGEIDGGSLGFYFDNCSLDHWLLSRGVGQSVRLVHDECIKANITANADPTDGGAISGTGEYCVGDNCTLEAIAASGYVFVNWTENGEQVSDSRFYSFLVTGSRDLVANFQIISIPDGSINSLFTINNNGDQVYFSRGNLQYQASTDTWRFAENQWEFVGGVSAYGTGECGNVFVNGIKCDNANISSTYDGWIDLFGWGTSGYDHGANCYQPWSTSANNEDYYAYGGEELSLDAQTGQADWGYNAISNGGNAENTWRTLTGGDNGEWEYILFSRETSSGIHFAKAVVNDVDGLILVPDNWDNSNYELASPNDDMAAYSSNIIPLSVWDDVFETSGCVFLPSGGFRGGNMYSISISPAAVLTIGLYWSSTYDLDARSIIILGSSIVSSRSDRGGGCAVRLVRDYVPSDQ